MMESRSFTRDRISDLPDQVLTQILSLLSTEEAARTSVFSKRWRRVWVSVPVLVFDHHKFLAWGMSDEELIEREVKFITFAKHVLYLRETLPLDTFKLTWWSKFSSTHTPAFEILRHAARCTPRVFSIGIHTCKIFNLPDSIFTCALILEMSLSVKTDDLSDHFIEPKSISLPSLRKLELRHLKINENFMRMLLSGCPALEEFILDSCYLFAHEISSPVLKKLSLMYYFQDTEIQISCPAVVSLKIYSNNAGGIILKNMSSLVNAEIFFENLDLSDSIDHDLKLLHGLSNVTTLELCTARPEVLDLLVADIPNCQTLENLKDLELGQLDANYDWNIVACFLQLSPNLKKLTLYFSQSEDVLEEDPVGDVAFQREYLEMVEIRCGGKSAKFAGEVVQMLGELIETIGKIDILC